MKTTRILIYTFLAALISSSIILAGCDRLPFGTVTIGEIIANPAKYESKEVKVKGKVSDSMKIPFVEIKMYTLKDGTGEILVIPGASLPGMNESVTVKGVVDSALIVGGQAAGLKIRESKRF